MVNLPKVNFKFLRNTFFLIIFASAVFVSGYFFGYKGFVASVKKFPIVKLTRQVPVDKKELDFNLFWNVWDTVHAKYFDKNLVIDSELVYGAIRGMVGAIGDPYTVFLPPKENKLVEEDLQGSFEGVGIQIGYRNKQLAVIAPLPGSPAEEVGIKAGDYIVEIKDEEKGIDLTTNGISLDKAVDTIRGKTNSTVTLTLIREDVEKPIIVDVKRRPIDVQSIIVNYPNNEKSVAHVKLTKFAAESMSEWDKAVIELLKEPELKAVVFDVRNNPGGYLQGAVEIASDFLETGDVVVKEQNYLGQKEEYKVTKIGRLKTIKLAVLVNQGSASASEIFAGAIKDHDRGKIVGDKTFGKGTIQEPEQITGGAGLHITIAKWLTPNEIWVHEKGLTPDFEIKDNEETDEDEQLNKAIEVVKS